jgi:hypothetical protein
MDSLSPKESAGYGAVLTGLAPIPSGGDYAEIACPSCPSDDWLRDRFGCDDRSGSCPYGHRHERARLLEPSDGGRGPL